MSPLIQPSWRTDLVRLVRDRIIAALSKGHPLEKHETISIHDLQAEPFIMPKGSYRAQIERILEQAGITPRVRFILTCPSIACASPAVQAFLSVAQSCFESNE